MKKLLLVGPPSVHIFNYIKLISGYFDDILLLTNDKISSEDIKSIKINFSLRNPLNIIFSVRKIKNIIKEYNPSCIHIHQANSYAYYTLKAAKNSNIPIVLTAWGSDILLLPKTGIFLSSMVKYNLRNATAFTSDSVYMAGEIRKLLPNKKFDITIANFGISITTITMPKENIIYTNRLHQPMYRIDKIINAFGKFIETQTEDWKLIIAGIGDETNNLKALSTKLSLNNKIEFTGWLESKENSIYYAKAKIFISIPKSDATSISLLEAMASGCLPVLSNLPANREWVKDKENGLLVDDLDSNFFEEALKINFENSSKINKELTEKHASQEINRNKFITLYDRILAV